MGRLLTSVLWTLAAVAGLGMSALADIPPPYTPYGIGASIVPGEPFPKLVGVLPGGAAAAVGLKNGDGVIAINGTYTRISIPFMYIERMLRGPKESVVELIVVRDDKSVSVVRVRRVP